MQQKACSHTIKLCVILKNGQSVTKNIGLKQQLLCCRKDFHDKFNMWTGIPISQYPRALQDGKGGIVASSPIAHPTTRSPVGIYLAAAPHLCFQAKGLHANGSGRDWLGISSPKSCLCRSPGAATSAVTIVACQWANPTQWQTLLGTGGAKEHSPIMFWLAGMPLWQFGIFMSGLQTLGQSMFCTATDFVHYKYGACQQLQSLYCEANQLSQCNILKLQCS